MALDPQIKKTLQQQVYVAYRAAAPSASGDPTFGSASIILCRVERVAQRVTGANGEELMSDTQILSDEYLDTACRIWVDDYPTTSPRVPKAVSAGTNELGNVDYYVAYL